MTQQSVVPPSRLTMNEDQDFGELVAVRFVPQTPRRNEWSRERLVRQMRDQFEAARGPLTLEQAAQQFGISTAACLRIVCRLVDEGALVLTSDHRNQLCVHATPSRPHGVRFERPGDGGGTS